MQIENNLKWLSGRCRLRVFVTNAATVLALLLLLYSPTNAAERSISDWQSEWQRVMAAANKEGKVVVSVPPGAEWRKALKETFERRFGIELELVTGRGSAIVKKISDEHRAGVQFFDVHTGGAGTIIYGLAGIVEPSSPSLFYRRSRTRKTGGRPHVRGQSESICLFVFGIRAGSHL